jgi:hypothetical protein
LEAVENNIVIYIEYKLKLNKQIKYNKMFIRKNWKINGGSLQCIEY